MRILILYVNFNKYENKIITVLSFMSANPRFDLSIIEYVSNHISLFIKYKIYHKCTLNMYKKYTENLSLLRDTHI